MVREVIDEEICTFASHRFQRTYVYITTFLMVVGMTSIVGIFNGGMVEFLAATIPSITPGFYNNLWVPAVQEEVLTRLVPGAVTLLALYLMSDHICYDVASEAYRLGAIGAFAMGVTELYVRIMVPSGIWTPFVWKHPNFHVSLLAPLVMHMIAGTIVLGTFYRVRGQKLTAIFGGLAIGIAIHWVFNTWMQAQVWFWRAWSQEFGIPITLGVLLVLGLIVGDVLDAYLEDPATRQEVPT